MVIFCHAIGWANVMQAIKVLGLLEVGELKQSSWHDYLRHRVGVPATATVGPADWLTVAVTNYLNTEGSVRDVPAAIAALQWVGILATNGSPEAALKGSTPLDALSSLLGKRLQYKEGERDMVAMFHTVEGVFPDGTTERHTSRLLDFGETTRDGDSAMSKTVGYTTGAAAELLLNGNVPVETGVVIPIQSGIYEPILTRLKDFGISWTDRIEISKK